MNLLQKHGVVLHVFEPAQYHCHAVRERARDSRFGPDKHRIHLHLNGHGKIVALNNIQSTLVVANVASDDVDVLPVEATSLGISIDEFTLRVAVGDTCDFGIWELYCARGE